MKPPAVRDFSVVGISGFDYWPDVNSVCNIEPLEDITVGNLPTDNFFAVRVMSHGEIVETVDAVDGLITIPASLTAHAFDNRISLVLVKDSMPYLGVISFLPKTKSADYNYHGFVGRLGNFRDSESHRCTGFESMEDVVDIVVSGKSTVRACCLVAYDKENVFVRVLLETGTFNNVHIVPDGSYSSVRACSEIDGDYSLELYYRRRK